MDGNIFLLGNALLMNYLNYKKAGEKKMARYKLEEFHSGRPKRYYIIDNKTREYLVDKKTGSRIVLTKAEAMEYIKNLGE